MTRACLQRKEKTESIGNGRTKAGCFKLLYIFVQSMLRACKYPKEIGGFVADGARVMLCSIGVC